MKLKLEKVIINNTPEHELVIVEKLEQMRSFLIKTDPLKNYDRVCEICSKLEEKYNKSNDDEVRKYYLFHRLTYSGIKREECPYLDFPGEDSLILSLEKLCAEYEDGQKFLRAV